jgi:ubiquinone/menaquinone biosynthesis C-methylase UbiE
VDSRDAVGLLSSAIHTRGGTWADLGAGDGVFTRALAEVLGAGSRIYAVDRDAPALAALERWATRSTHDVVTVTADFTRPFELPDLGDAKLDGLLLANSLHFVRDADAVLARLVESLKRGGDVVLVEYDRRGASRWVPYPVSSRQLSALAGAAGLSPFEVTAALPSAFGGELYAAVARKG